LLNFTSNSFLAISIFSVDSFKYKKLSFISTTGRVFFEVRFLCGSFSFFSV
jgi:hypothetical protein